MRRARVRSPRAGRSRRLGPASTDAPPGSSDGITTTTGAAPTAPPPRGSRRRPTATPRPRPSRRRAPSRPAPAPWTRRPGSVTTRSTRTDPTDRSRTTQTTTRSADALRGGGHDDAGVDGRHGRGGPVGLAGGQQGVGRLQDLGRLEGLGQLKASDSSSSADSSKSASSKAPDSKAASSKAPASKSVLVEALVLEVVGVLGVVGLEEVDVLLGQVAHVEGLGRLHRPGDHDVGRQRHQRDPQERHELERRLEDDLRLAVLERHGRVLGHLRPVVRGDLGHGGMVVTALGAGEPTRRRVSDRMAAPVRTTAGREVRAHRAWVPRHVRVTRSAQEHPHAAEIVRRCEALGITDIELLRGDRVTGVRGDDRPRDLRAGQGDARRRRQPRLRPQLAPDPAERRLAGRPGRGCPAHCQYCYLAGSLTGPPITRVYADLDAHPRQPRRLRRPRQRSPPTNAGAPHEGTTFEASCYTDPLGSST